MYVVPFVYGLLVRFGTPSLVIGRVWSARLIHALASHLSNDHDHELRLRSRTKLKNLGPLDGSPSTIAAVYE